MPDLSIQFHALPEEIAKLVMECLSAELHVIGLTFPPFAATELASRQVANAIIEGPYWRLVFVEKKPSFPIRSASELAEMHPGALYLDIGREGDKGLGESWLACRTSSGVPISERWKYIAKKLKAITSSGAFATDPKTGISSRIKNHRFTEGAKKLDEKGRHMLPTAGRILISFRRPEGSPAGAGFKF